MLLNLLWFVLIFITNAHGNNAADQRLQETFNNQNAVSGAHFDLMDRRRNTESTFIKKSTKRDLIFERPHKEYFEELPSQDTIPKDLPQFAPDYMDKSLNTTPNDDENNDGFHVYHIAGAIFGIFSLVLLCINIPFVCAFRKLQQTATQEIHSKVIDDFNV